MNDLFDPPAFHTTDPPSSRDALDAHEATGRREQHKAIVLELVRRFPRRTAIELWECAGDEQATLKEPQEVRRRLYDLHKTGIVHQRDARKCSVRLTKQITWEAV